MSEELCQLLVSKGVLKQEIFKSTLECMQHFKEAAKTFDEFFKANYAKGNEKIPVYFKNKNQHLFQLRFAGDVLIFIMHTNIFEFPRDHEVMRSNYIKENKDRSYCGMISIFNFLSDSFKYNRVNDIGYMIGRILINRDLHFFVEGKRELAQILNNFSQKKFSKESAIEIINSAIKYTLNFDLLLPNYDITKEVSVSDMLQMEDQIMTIKTAKRLGFRFEKDNNSNE